MARYAVKYKQCAKSDTNLRRNTVFKIKKKKKNLIEGRRKKWLWKEFDTTRRERSKNGFRVMLTRVSHSLRKRD
jgi:hypothetical protein